MNQDIIIEIIKIIPSLVWTAFSIALLIVFYQPIRRELIPKMTGLKAFGIEATFVKQELERLAERAPAGIVGTERTRNQVARRAERIKSILQNAHVLIVNDIPSEMNNVINILESLGIKISVVKSTAEALEMMRRRQFDTVISDMRRGDSPNEGQIFLQQTIEQNLSRPTIFTVGHLEPGKGVPPYAFGITNRVDEMLNLVFDALERVRG